MLGKTNATSSNGGGGDIISAVNRSGKMIGKGEKVWIIPEASEAGSGFEFFKNGSNETYFMSDRSCNYVRANTALYYLGNNTSEVVVSGFTRLNEIYPTIYNYSDSVACFESNPYAINILYQGQCLKPWSINSSSLSVVPSNSKTLVYWLERSIAKSLFSYNLETKEITQYSADDTVNFGSDGKYFVIDEKLYALSSTSSYAWCAQIDLVGKTITKIGQVNTVSIDKVLGITNDNKYIIAKDSGIKIIELVNETTLKLLTVDEVPELSECYAPKFNVQEPNFLPDNQIIAYAEFGGLSIDKFAYGVFQYTGGGNWKKLNIIMPIEPPKNLSYVPTQYYHALIISKDLTKAIVGYWNSNSRTMLYRYNLETFDGYNLYGYRRELITENVLTGKSSQDIANSETGEVQTILP